MRKFIQKTTPLDLHFAVKNPQGITPIGQIYNQSQEARKSERFRL